MDPEEFWNRPNSIMICEDIRGQGQACVLCKKEDARLEIGIRLTPKGSKRLMMQIGYNCAIGFEATFRHFRKWSIRGGALK